jgi:DNA-binding CsgD family transcriptional regulator
VDVVEDLFRAGLTLREIARRTGRGLTTVRIQLVRKGLHRVRHKSVRDGVVECKRCGHRGPADEFPAVAAGNYLCQACREAQLHASSIRRHGCTAAEYQELLVAQGGKCAICDAPAGHQSCRGKVCRLSVDHDHKTGTIRGLLCNNCNRGLGRFQDSVKLLIKAARYLQRGREQERKSRSHS